MSNIPYSNITYLEERIEDVKGFVRRYEKEMREYPEETIGILPAYVSYKRLLEDMQSQLTEAKREKLAAVS